MELLGYPTEIFQVISKPGETVGMFSEAVREMVGFDCEVLLPATHDTASAVMAVPSNEEDTVYLSSGTWSLMGVERLDTDCSPQSMNYNFIGHSKVVQRALSNKRLKQRGIPFALDYYLAVHTVI